MKVGKSIVRTQLRHSTFWNKFDFLKSGTSIKDVKINDFWCCRDFVCTEKLKIFLTRSYRKLPKDEKSYPISVWIADLTLLASLASSPRNIKAGVLAEMSFRFHSSCEPRFLTSHLRAFRLKGEGWEEVYDIGGFHQEVSVIFSCLFLFSYFCHLTVHPFPHFFALLCLIIWVKHAVVIHLFFLRPWAFWALIFVCLFRYVRASVFAYS